ncbi:alkyl hydroperoxide reductase subunit F [Agilicoccus flavus]|uniref:alkyl hydroperoxide reductase subunit F n=1 Tax=Agilicoccus flavus TaxID=2775968 RepID=UPI001CF61B1C|nr:alkyl hydroperoxide reductase subunit F [Agilicoccus flavus]
MLDSALITQVNTLMTNLRRPVELVATLDDRPASAQMRELLTEIAEQSDLITASFDGDDERAPSFAVTSPGTGIDVRFAGLPLGHEFSSLVLALLHVGGHTVKEEDDVVAAIQGLTGEYEFVTYMSLSCQNCPTVVQALNTMAALNPRIRHTAVEGSLFQDEVNGRNVLAVPTVYLDGEVFGQGRMDAAEIVAKLDTGADARAAEKLEARDPYDVLVVGGGPAGASAAIYAARKGIRTGLVAERFGGQVLDTMAIENLVSVPYTEGPKLAASLREHVDAYDVDVLTGYRAAGLAPAGEQGLATVEFEGGGSLSARSVVLATGARWRTMGVPGEDEYRNKGVTFCPHCDGPLFRDKPVAVVGGGNSGVEAAIDLAGVVRHVTVVEFLTELKADDVLQRKLRSLPNVDVVLGARTTEVTGDGTSVTGLTYEDRATGQTRSLAVNGVFVQIGLLPNTGWLDGSVELTDRGEVVVDEKGHTSAPGVVAAGDCTTVPFKQIVVALGAGSTASLSAFDHLVRATAPA